MFFQALFLSEILCFIPTKQKKQSEKSMQSLYCKKCQDMLNCGKKTRT